jgi:hypothetical protein
MASKASQGLEHWDHVGDVTGCHLLVYDHDPMPSFELNYKGNLTWLPKSVIYLTRHGSHAYGTSLPESDVDIRGAF